MATTERVTQQARERAENIAERGQDAISQAASTIERGLKSIVPADQEPKVEEGLRILKRYLNLPLTFSLESEIVKAQNVLTNLKDFPAYIDGKLVSNLIKNTDAVVFLTNARAGLFLTGQVGTGLIIAKLPDGSWSAPSAIGYVGSGFGVQGGWDVTDYVLLLGKAGIESFLGNNQLVLSGDFGLTIGLGRHGTGELHIGKNNFSTTVGYAFSKGFFAGAAAQAGLIRTRRNVNKKFYGRDVDPADLLRGKVSKPRAARALYEKLAALP